MGMCTDHPPSTKLRSASMALAFLGILFVLANLELRQSIGQLSLFECKVFSSTTTKTTLVSAADPSHPAARPSIPYAPSKVEQYVFEHAIRHGYHHTAEHDLPPLCPLWTDANYTHPPGILYDALNQYRVELADYAHRLSTFQQQEPPIEDLRIALRQGLDHATVCRRVELHEDGLAGIFSSSQLLSHGPFGAIEPLVQPLRHPEYCVQRPKRLMDISYLVHDFGVLCRRISAHSRFVFIDMGASLQFGGSGSPVLELLRLYRHFGFPMDHIYAYEISPTDPSFVFERVPEDQLLSYHWINVGVSADPTHRLNPLYQLLNGFTKDDVVIVKLDIDTPSIELPLAQQLLNDTRLHQLVDHFYFEHHVAMNDILAPYAWKYNQVQGSFHDSLQLFAGLRQKGIAAHSWV